MFDRLDEARSDVGEHHTAFSGERSPRYAAFALGVCPPPELLAAERARVGSFGEALRLHATGLGSDVDAMAEYEDERVDLGVRHR